MAFHIRNGRSIERELGRLARDEFRTALEQLGESHPDEEAIHDARKIGRASCRERVFVGV